MPEWFGRPNVVAVEGDVLSSERGDMGEKLVGDGFATGARFIDGAPETDGVPKDDRGNREIDTRDAVALIFKCAVSDFAEMMEEHRPCERVAGLAFVEAGVGAVAQGGIADPIDP